MRSFKHIGGLSAALTVLSVFAASQAHAAGVTMWSGSAGANFLTKSNWTANTGAFAPPGTTDEALFNGVGQFSPTTGIGIDFSLAYNATQGTNLATNYGTQQESVGAILLNAANTTTRIIGNDSATVTNGTLFLQGYSQTTVASPGSAVTLLLGNYSAVGLTLQNTAYTGFAAGDTMAVSLATFGNVEIDGAGGIAISSVVTGSGGFNKTGTGAGLFTLSGANTYTGGTTITGGTLQVTGTTSLGTGAVTDNATLLFTLAADSAYSNAISGTGALTTNGGVLTLTGANTYSGATTVAAGGLVLNANAGGSLNASTSLVLAGNFTLIGSDSATTTQNLGGLTLTAGAASTITVTSGSGQSTTLALGAITRGGDSPLSFALNNVGGGTASITTTSANNASGILGGYATINGTDWASVTGGVIGPLATYNTDNFAAATNNVDVTTADSLSGNTTVSTVRFATAGAASVAVGAGNTLTLATGGILVSAAVGANASSVTGGTLTTGDTFGAGMNGDLFLHQNNTSGTLAISSVIANNGSVALDLVKDGAGVAILSGANTYSGGTTLYAGTLRLGSTTALGTGALTINGGALDASTALTNANNNAIVVNSDFGFTGTANLNMGTGAVSLGTAAGTTRTITTTAGTLTIGGVIANGTTATGITKAGTGTLALTGANTFNGAATVSAGAIQLGNSLALQNAAVTLSTGVTNGLTFAAGLGSATVGSLSGSGSLALADTASAAVALTEGGNNAGTTYSGVLSGIGSLTKVGTGLLVLSGSNTFSGGLTLNAGTIAIVGSGGAAAIGSSTNPLTVNAGTFYLSGYSPTVGQLSGTGGSISSGYPGTAYAGTLTVNQNTNTTYAGTLINASTTNLLGLRKSGTGTLTLTGANTYTGTTTVNGGTLAVNANSGGTLAATPLALGGGTFSLIGSNSAATAINLGGLTLNAGASAISNTSGTNQTSALALGAITRVTTGGEGIDFRPTNTGTGTASFTTTTANGTGGILGGYATVGGTTWAVSAGTGTVAGAVTGLATYSTNDFTTAANNVDASGTNTLPSGTTTINSLRFNTAGTSTVAVGTGNTLTLATGGILDTANSGTSSITGGTLTTGDALSATLGELFVHQNNTTSSLTISSVIANTSATDLTDLVKDGAGTLVLTATETYTGTTFINAGTLQLGNNGTVGNISNSATSIVNNGQLILNRSSTGVLINAVISGTGSVTQMGSGSFYLTSSNTYTGGTYINRGTLEIANGASLGTAPATGNAASGNNVYFNGGTLQLASGAAYPGSTRYFVLNGAGGLDIDGDTGTYAGQISGVGGFTISNSNTTAATITLTGTNTFSGGLTVNSGTVVAGSASALGSTANTLTVNGGVLAVNGRSFTFSGLSGTGGTIENNSAATAVSLTVNQSANTTYAGVIVDGAAASFGLKKGGTGALTLTGANTYTGGTAITAGTLATTGTGVGTGAVTVASGATLGVGEAVNSTGAAQSVSTLSASSVAVTSASGNATPALTFNLGAGDTSGGFNGVNDLLTLTGATPLTFSGAGLFDIGFASATGGSLTAGSYTLLTFAVPQTSGLPSITSYQAVPQGNLGAIGNPVFAYTTDSNGSVTGLTFSLTGADAMPEPGAAAFALPALPLPGGFLAVRRRRCAV